MNFYMKMMRILTHRGVTILKKFEGTKPMYVALVSITFRDLEFRGFGFSA